jgi:membrane fusion protein, heavy metal efflux system
LHVREYDRRIEDLARTAMDMPAPATKEIAMEGGRRAGPLRFLARRGPTVLVLVALAGLGIYGHRTGWTVPKVSALWGRSRGPETEDWCPTHNVPASKCIACHPELAGADPKDWCKEHGVPESKCAICHPEILTKGRADDWCGEHGVPESGCTICNPGLAVKGEAPASGSPTVSLDPKAPPAASPAACLTHLLRVQFASADAVTKAGIRLEAVQERPMAASIAANGEIDYDGTRVAHLSSKVPGTVWRVEKDVGQPVQKGEVLALVDAAEVGRAKAELLQAAAQVDVRETTFERVRASSEKGLRTGAELLEAEAALREARVRLFVAEQALVNLGMAARAGDVAGLPEEKRVERLRFLGLPDAIRSSIAAETPTANLIPVAAPFDGIVVSRSAVAGESADAAKTLFVVADTSRMWASLDVRIEDMAALTLGQAVAFRGPDLVSKGTVNWISTAVDEKTRTLRVRAVLENPEGRLRAHTFGTARITTREAPKAVAVPDEAIQWEGCCHVVFVRLTGEVFGTRKVRLGARSGGFTEVLVGLVPGEVVATAGSHVLKSEILKSKLGAGCVDE